MRNDVNKKQCDVLVIGGGGAGVRAAIAAREAAPNMRVIMATKGKLGVSGVTAVACSDRMAFHATLPHTEPGGDDAWIYHAEDIYDIGGRVSDAHLAAVLAENAADAYSYLESIGVPFVQKDGLPHQFVTDGSDYARACYTGPKTAVHIEEQLVQAFHRQDIDLLENCQVFRIIKEDDRVTGVLALIPGEDGEEEPLLIETPAVIMATGGGGEIYADNVFPRGNSGDGFTAAYLAGAELVNMEFIQLGVASLKTKLNCSGSLMRAIPRVVNDDGEEVLFKYFPPDTDPMQIYNYLFQKGASWPVTFEHKTHIFDIVFYKERAAGNRVYLDYSANPSGFDFQKMDPDLQRRYREEMKEDLGETERHRHPLSRLLEINRDSVIWLQERGVDLEGGDMIEVGACAQHFQGGIKINSRGETTVKGLYAAGECAGGQHGANRPGGNALLDGQVFGKICGENAAAYAGQKGHASVNNSLLQNILQELQALENGKGIPAGEARRTLQNIMTGCASIVRTEDKLKKGFAELEQLQHKQVTRDEAGLAFAVETEAMYTVAEAVLRAARQRDESRGPHLRFSRYEDNEPVPRRDPEWQQYMVLYLSEEGRMQIELRDPIRDYKHRD